MCVVGDAAAAPVVTERAVAVSEMLLGMYRD